MQRSFFIVFLGINYLFFPLVSQNLPPSILGNTLPQPIGWVNDFENLYSALEERALDSMIQGFKDETTMEIALVSLDSFWVSGRSIDTIAKEIGNFWGVGLKGLDNGVVVAISKSMRKIRLAYGKGIESCISEEAGSILIRDYFIPNFKRDAYFQGTIEGLSRLMELMKQ